MTTIIEAPAAPPAPAEPAAPVGVLADCETCGAAISATNCQTPPTRCYWCANGVTPADLVTAWRTTDGGAW